MGCGQVSSGQQRACACRHDALIKTRFLVIVDPQAWLNGERIGDFPACLAKQCRAGAFEKLRVARGEASQDRRVVRKRACQVPAAGSCALLFKALRIDPLLKTKSADDEIEFVACIIIAKFLTILVLL